MKRAFLTVALLSLAACGHRSASDMTAAPPSSTPATGQPKQQMSSHGAAGWVGQEFAGRTTANGEIFDPMLMTAAHRTLPFGTLLDVHNPKTGQTVRVRVNDRGPYVGDRLIDLSYAAAQQIGIAESGGGDIDMSVVKMGRGEREPPAPFPVTMPESTVAAMPATPAPAPVTPEPAPMPVTPTPVPAPQPQPAPAPVQLQPAPAPSPATVDRIEVTERHAGAPETRRQVAPNGKSLVDVPTKPRPAPATTPESHPATSRSGRYIVQVGAFSQEINAKALQNKLKTIGQESNIAHTSLYFVRIGPFETRDQAAAVRSKLEAKGISAIVMTQ